MSFTPEQLLHDRATRGEELSPEEQVLLDAWYAMLEQQEMSALFGNAQPVRTLPSVSSEHLAFLQQQIDSLLTQLSATMAQIQALSEQNKTLRAEVLVLRNQATQQLVMAPA